MQDRAKNSRPTVKPSAPGYPIGLKRTPGLLRCSFNWRSDSYAGKPLEKPSREVLPSTCCRAQKRSLSCARGCPAQLIAKQRWKGFILFLFRFHWALIKPMPRQQPRQQLTVHITEFRNSHVPRTGDSIAHQLQTKALPKTHQPASNTSTKAAPLLRLAVSRPVWPLRDATI